MHNHIWLYFQTLYQEFNQTYFLFQNFQPFLELSKTQPIFPLEWASIYIKRL